MRYLKTFESLNTDIKVSEANKIKSLPGFTFFRVYSGISGYHLSGKRNTLPMESINISKDNIGNFILNIRRSPGYFKDLIAAGQDGWEEDWNSREFNSNYKFEDIESLKEFLLNYKWYDLI